MAKTEIVFNGTKEGYERLKALGPEKLSEILGVKVTEIGPFEPEGATGEGQEVYGSNFQQERG